MWKCFLYLLVFLFTSNTVHSQTVLKATIKKIWTVDSARQEAFLNLEKTKDLSMFDYIDPNFIENKQSINNKQFEVNNRKLTFFSKGNYTVRVLEDDLFNKGFTYDLSGKLKYISFYVYAINIKNVDEYKKVNSKLIYPYKVYWYLYPEGYIDFVEICINKNDAYIFMKDGSLNAHWIGNKGYDINGKVFSTKQDAF